MVTPVPEHPNLPRRGALAVMFCAITLSGMLGGLIGRGIVAASSSRRVPLLLGALAGTVIVAVGAGVVGALVMRAQSEWRTRRPRPSGVSGK